MDDVSMRENHTSVLVSVSVFMCTILHQLFLIIMQQHLWGFPHLWTVGFPWLLIF